MKKQLKLAVVLAGFVGVGCSQSKAAEVEPAVHRESAPVAPAAAIPAAVARPEVGSMRAAAPTSPLDVAPVSDVAPAPVTAAGSLAPASKLQAKSSPSAHSKAASLSKKSSVGSSF
jgi:hypothetical protein